MPVTGPLLWNSYYLPVDSFGKKERRKVDRVFANHYLSQPPVSRNFQHSLSLLSSLGINRQAQESITYISCFLVPVWRWVVNERWADMEVLSTLSSCNHMLVPQVNACPTFLSMNLWRIYWTSCCKNLLLVLEALHIGLAINSWSLSFDYQMSIAWNRMPGAGLSLLFILLEI